jgi:hypothetical protein
VEEVVSGAAKLAVALAEVKRVSLRGWSQDLRCSEEQTCQTRIPVTGHWTRTHDRQTPRRNTSRTSGVNNYMGLKSPNALQRTAIAVILAFVFLLACVLGSRLGVSHYRRWQASRVLGVVRQFHPGTTSEADALAALRPFVRYRTRTGVNDLEFAFENLAPLPWTRFSIDIHFVGGFVAEVHITEMQVDHPGSPHPNSASVTIYSNRLGPVPPDFNGYSEYSRSTGGVDGQGNWNGFECCHARFIRLDERATPAQMSRSLTFRLSCMTSFVRCKVDRQILP